VFLSLPLAVSNLIAFFQAGFDFNLRRAGQPGFHRDKLGLAIAYHKNTLKLFFRLLAGGQSNVFDGALALVRRQIGFMSANTAVYDRMTAWEMVEYFGRLYGIAQEPLRERMEELFTRLQMNEIRDVLGAKMSTGMKQKVSIARAIVHDPPVLIFDEATSALDSANERAIQGELSQAAQGRTTLVIAHRLSTIVDADSILVLDQGRIVERGSFADLISAQGVFARMWALQQEEAEREAPVAA
jgi:ABC-type multidrug transport system fused ATPase/permease subunit